MKLDSALALYFPLTISELVELLTELLIRFIAFFLAVTTTDSSYFSRQCAREAPFFPKFLKLFKYIFTCFDKNLNKDWTTFIIAWHVLNVRYTTYECSGAY